MNWRDIVALAGHGGEQVFCIVEAHAAPRQARERVTAGRQQIQRRPVSGDVDDDIGQRAGCLRQLDDRILGAHVDGKVSAELRRQRQPVGIASAQAGHHHETGTGLFSGGGAQPAAQAGLAVDGEKPVDIGQAVPRAAPILPCPAGRTGPAGLEHLDGHPVAGGHTPMLCRSGPMASMVSTVS